MRRPRIIARLDIKNEHVIKGIQLEGLRKIGEPNAMAVGYYNDGADELLFMDAVASLYGRNGVLEIVEGACRDVFVPITVGGGIRTVQDIEAALRAGADKVAINTAAFQSATLIDAAARYFGSQCIVGSVEAKKRGGHWEAFTETGRQETGVDAVAWAKRLEGQGAGEIMVTSIDRDGTKKGYDVELLKQVREAVTIPVIGSGGAGTAAHVAAAFSSTDADGLAIATALHYRKTNIRDIKALLHGTAS
ncbi:MAG: imidazole glycerol phosphate synthase subunit HisF [Polyangiaceae bacterium]|nr:imidazole glycerol phosphate synthase subunit HisF [Polyangiaceae bacterium]